jgi:hypothetical protein
LYWEYDRMSSSGQKTLDKFVFKDGEERWYILGKQIGGSYWY